ncbi:hypothetical protein ACWC1D_27480 [Streptomyces sp. NPDC001478]
MPRQLTVGRLLRQLQGLDADLPIRLAVNPDFPFAHYVGSEVVVRNGHAFITDDGQDSYLPPDVSRVLGWS